MKLTHHNIQGDTPSSHFQIPVYEFGDKNAPHKIYLQAGMHADEHPGMLVLNHLMDSLEAAEAAGNLNAYFVILPVVNPLGLVHITHHAHRGRYHLTNGLNYNRGWPDFAKMILADTSVCAKFGDDAASNKKLVRDWIANWLATTTPITALEKQRHIVMRHCFDADMVLDLHCDDMALNHIYIVPQNIPRYQGLSDRLGSVATLLAEDSGGGSFDEVWSGLWISLQDALPDHAWPDPVLSATLEYRGQADVYDDIAKQDAINLHDFFCDEDLIASAPSTPLAPACTPTALNACEIVRVTSSGLIAYHVSLGDVVKTGDIIADLISLDGTAPARERTPIYAGTDGIVFSMLQSKYVWPGTSIAKIAGTSALASRGTYLLED